MRYSLKVKTLVRQVTVLQCMLCWLGDARCSSSRFPCLFRLIAGGKEDIPVQWKLLLGRAGAESPAAPPGGMRAVRQTHSAVLFPNRQHKQQTSKHWTTFVECAMSSIRRVRDQGTTTARAVNEKKYTGALGCCIGMRQPLRPPMLAHSVRAPPLERVRARDVAQMMILEQASTAPLSHGAPHIGTQSTGASRLTCPPS